MTQNTSTAVMQNRKNTKASLDYFPTPPWATRALCHLLQEFGMDLSGDVCEEPACGGGHMVRPLREFFKTVHAFDCQPYGWDHGLRDFLTMTLPTDYERPDWIITNPPFKAGEAFSQLACERAKKGSAMLVRSAFLEGVGRHANLFLPYPPAFILQFVERVPMLEGRLDPKASSATAYCWIVWLQNWTKGTRFGWIPPVRKALERIEDYQEMVA